MIEAVFGKTGEVCRFVASIPPFDAARDFGNCVAIGWVEDGNLIGGTVYHNWSPEAGVIELSTATTSPRWLTRKSLQTMFGYPFDQLGCQMVVLRVSEHNARMRDIAKRFGFSETTIPRLRGRNEAECIYCLTVEQWNEKGRPQNRKTVSTDAS
jgi:RimJ/RimL family protein N-acetyltransferase